MKSNSTGRLALWVLALCTTLGVAAAAYGGWLGAGCWICDYVTLTGPYERCEMVGNNEHGTGINCYETYLFGWYCETSGGPCYNVDVIDDPPDGGGGHVCTKAPGEWCPPECPTCTDDPFKY